ncbi:FxSxx-COOH system tetratricopeptide repeat protein [Actinosynnema sp. CA-299493]
MPVPVTQTGTASGEARFYQAGRDINVGAPPLVPRMESVPAVAGVGRVPMGSGVFVGRSGELGRLEAAITRPSGRAVVAAVHGLGGVGKSALAARFAELHAGRFTPVWWVTADSAAGIETGLAELAAAVAPEAAVLPSEQRVELGVRWLATHEGWLLVLDNVTTPHDVAELLGRVRTGTILITSRQRSGWRGVETVPLDVLADDEAVELLGRIVRSEWPGADLDGAEALCEELGWLPLAVEQAGAYLAQTCISPAAYLDLLARFPARMFTATVEGGDAQRTMARVWHVTLDRLADTPAAGRVLRLVAWFAPDGIPRALLAGAVGEPELSEVLGRLAAYNMIALTADTVSVHRLVQAVTRIPDPTDPHRQPTDIALARETATTILTSIVSHLDPWSPTSWPFYRLVLPHARALLDHSTSDTDTTHSSLLLNDLGRYLEKQGNVGTAAAYQSRATANFERLLGRDHPNTLASRSNLANTYQAAGELRQAVQLLESTLADSERVLGHDDPGTLAVRNNLAYAYREIGDLSRSLTLFEATLADFERVVGYDDPRTLNSRNNLAGTYHEVGDLERAIPLYELALADYERVLGVDHPETLSSRNDLAGAYEVVGDLERAISLHEVTLADRERVLGSDHPETLTSRNNLANVYRSAGDLERAIPMFEGTLADSERVLGLDHPHTLNSRSHLAFAYQSAGDLERAIPMFKAVLADFEQVLGSDHPQTLAVRNNLASTYKSSGDLDRAVSMFEAALADSERVLGSDHPNTLSTRNNLAYATGDLSDPGHVIPLSPVHDDRQG